MWKRRALIGIDKKDKDRTNANANNVRKAGKHNNDNAIRGKQIY